MAAGSGILGSAPDSILEVTQPRACGTARYHNPPRPLPRRQECMLGEKYVHTPIIVSRFFFFFTHISGPLKRNNRKIFCWTSKYQELANLAVCCPEMCDLSRILHSHTVGADKSSHLVISCFRCCKWILETNLMIWNIIQAWWTWWRLKVEWSGLWKSLHLSAAAFKRSSYSSNKSPLCCKSRYYWTVKPSL